jgi:hypothetical protein
VGAHDALRTRLRAYHSRGHNVRHDVRGFRQQSVSAPTFLRDCAPWGDGPETSRGFLYLDGFFIDEVTEALQIACNPQLSPADRPRRVVQR